MIHVHVFAMMCISKFAKPGKEGKGELSFCTTFNSNYDKYSDADEDEIYA